MLSAPGTVEVNLCHNARLGSAKEIARRPGFKLVFVSLVEIARLALICVAMRYQRVYLLPRLDMCVKDRACALKLAPNFGYVFFTVGHG